MQNTQIEEISSLGTDDLSYRDPSIVRVGSDNAYVYSSTGWIQYTDETKDEDGKPIFTESSKLIIQSAIGDGSCFFHAFAKNCGIVNRLSKIPSRSQPPFFIDTDLSKSFTFLKFNYNNRYRLEDNYKKGGTILNRQEYVKDFRNALYKWLISPNKYIDGKGNLIELSQDEAIRKIYENPRYLTRMLHPLLLDPSCISLSQTKTKEEINSILNHILFPEWHLREHISQLETEIYQLVKNYTEEDYLKRASLLLKPFINGGLSKERIKNIFNRQQILVKDTNIEQLMGYIQESFNVWNPEDLEIFLEFYNFIKLSYQSFDTKGNFFKLYLDFEFNKIKTQYLQELKILKSLDVLSTLKFKIQCQRMNRKLIFMMLRIFLNIQSYGKLIMLK